MSVMAANGASSAAAGHDRARDAACSWWRPRTRSSAAPGAFLFSLWLSELGTAWFWSCHPVMSHSASRGAGRTNLGATPCSRALSGWRLDRHASACHPPYDEASSIARVLDEIPATLVAESAGLDAGSTDGTAKSPPQRRRVILSRARIRSRLLAASRRNDPDTSCPRRGLQRRLASGTLIEPIGAARTCLDPARSGRAGAMPWHAVFGNRLAATLIRWLYGISLTISTVPGRAPQCCGGRSAQMTYGGPSSS